LWGFMKHQLEPKAHASFMKFPKIKRGLGISRSIQIRQDLWPLSLTQLSVAQEVAKVEVSVVCYDHLLHGDAVSPVIF
jgi:hypothetical protein